MPFRGRIGEFVEVWRSRGELSLEWRIPRFLKLSGDYCDCYESPYFCFSDASWHFRVWLNCGSSESVDLDLWRHDDDDTSTRTVNFSVGVKGSGGVKKRVGRKWEFENVDCWRLLDFCTREELREQKHNLMLERALTVTCEMEVPETAARGILKLSKDLGKLLASGDKSDANVWVGDQEFQVHSLVLFARYPSLSIFLQQESTEKAANTIVVEDCELDTFRDFHVFYTGCVRSLTEDDVLALNRMADRYLVHNLSYVGIQKLSEDFGKLLANGDKSDVTVQHESVERTSNRIVVEDCRPDIFRDFLHFLYTGCVHSLTKDNTFGMYQISDRYLVDDLKRQCLEHVHDALSVDTFCDAVRLAVTYGQSGLMGRAVAFATKNIWSMISSGDWQTFVRECPTEANDVLQKSLILMCKRHKSSC